MSTVPVEIKPIENKLVILHERATSIQVKDSASYELACQIALDARKEIKAIGFALDPGIGSAREHLETLRNRKNAFVNKVKPIVDLASGKAAAWREQERLAAEVEQEKLNADRRRVAAAEAERARIAAEKEAARQEQEKKKEIERARKAGEFGKRDANRLAKEAAAQAEIDRQAARAAEETARVVKEVKVKPSIPKMAGIKGRTDWKFRIVDASSVPRQWLKPDELKIGSFVRSVKNKKQAEFSIPGIEVWSEDSV